MCMLFNNEPQTFKIFVQLIKVFQIAQTRCKKHRIHKSRVNEYETVDKETPTTNESKN